MIEHTNLWQQIFSELRGNSPLGEDNPFYPTAISYQPGGLARELVDSKQAVELLSVGSKELMDAPELNPTHLASQGIQSDIDPETNNLKLILPKGNIYIGFYDRMLAEEVNARQVSREKFVAGLPALLRGTDPDFPKFPIIHPESGIETLLGENYPPMLNYHSVVFPGSVIYGVVIGVDKTFLGEPEVFENVLINREYIEQNPRDVVMLYSLISKAARQKGLKWDDLQISSDVKITLGDRLGYFLALNKEYEVRVSYTRTPHINVVGRFEGIPLMMSQEGENQYVEVSHGLIDTGDMLIFPMSRGFIQNAADPDNSIVGELEYHAISREESIAQEAHRPYSGLMEVQIMRSFTVEDFQMDAKVVKDNLAQLESSSIREDYPSPFLMLGGEPTRGYTAGRTSLGNVVTARIETTQLYPHTVIARTGILLVHEEQQTLAIPYSPGTIL